MNKLQTLLEKTYNTIQACNIRKSILACLSVFNKFTCHLQLCLMKLRLEKIKLNLFPEKKKKLMVVHINKMMC